MTPDDRASLAEIQSISEAYAAAIETNAEIHSRDFHQESIAASLAALTCLFAGFRTREHGSEEYFGLVCSLAALVIASRNPELPTGEPQDRGGLVNAILKDMEWF